MPNVHITIKNLPQIRAAFSKAPRLMKNNFYKALTKSAVLVQSQSMVRSPVRTGRLRSSHTFQVYDTGINMRAEVGPEVYYALFVHEGTRFMHGRPFLKDAAESSTSQIDGFFTEAAQDALNTIGYLV